MAERLRSRPPVSSPRCAAERFDPTLLGCCSCSRGSAGPWASGVITTPRRCEVVAMGREILRGSSRRSGGWSAGSTDTGRLARSVAPSVTTGYTFCPQLRAPGPYGQRPIRSWTRRAPFRRCIQAQTPRCSSTASRTAGSRSMSNFRPKWAPLANACGRSSTVSTRGWLKALPVKSK